MDPFLYKLGISLPIIQAPMAGVSTPPMAAAVSNSGGLGSLGAGSLDAQATKELIRETRKRTDRPFNVNLFCNRPAQPDPTRERAWLKRLAPAFAQFQSQPPETLSEIYQSFLTDDAKLEVLLAERPVIVSFHFGLPDSKRIAALRAAGIILLATATNLQESRKIAEAGIDAVVAQGYEAGGHRGMFDPAAPDERLGMMALTRLLVRNLNIPVIASGGIMDGAGIAAALTLGAVAAQLGTAFIACPESAADAGYRAALLGVGTGGTTMTSAISGRPARCLTNRFTDLGSHAPLQAIPDYPIAYDAGKALHGAAKAAGEFGYGAHWAGQAAPLARALPAGELVLRLKEEWEEATSRMTSTVRSQTAQASPGQ